MDRGDSATAPWQNGAMHQLILLRHAKAVRGTAELSDHDRALTPEGKGTAKAMGAAMRGLGLIPDVILVSSALRTQETLDELEPWEDRPNIETMPGLYMASYHQIRDMLRELPETMRSVLVIGHNPGVHELAQLLAGEAGSNPAKPDLARLAEQYPTSALTEFNITTPWHKIGGPGATLKRFLLPADLQIAGR
jgi:phosphohistidine phosphatase